MHLIVDNFSTYKANLVKRFPDAHPNLKLHFVPTCPSWLYQVESWFSEPQPGIIDRGIVTSVADLDRKLLRYNRLNKKTVKPFHWKCSEFRRRICE